MGHTDGSVPCVLALLHFGVLSCSVGSPPAPSHQDGKSTALGHGRHWASPFLSSLMPRCGWRLLGHAGLASFRGHSCSFCGPLCARRIFHPFISDLSLFLHLRRAYGKQHLVIVFPNQTILSFIWCIQSTFRIFV